MIRDYASFIRAIALLLVVPAAWGGFVGMMMTGRAWFACVVPLGIVLVFYLGAVLEGKRSAPS
ncbi:MAG: hypothetical protein AAFQ53_00280 [Bacteroidota bacterium]